MKKELEACMECAFVRRHIRDHFLKAAGVKTPQSYGQVRQLTPDLIQG